MGKEEIKNSKIGLEHFKNASGSINDLDNILDDRIDALILKKGEGKEKGRASNSIKIGLVSLVILILALVIFYILKPTPSPKNEQVFAANFEIFKNVITPIERGQNAVANELSKGLQLYSKHNFKEAIPKLEKYLENGENEKSEESELVKMYLAISYLADSNPKGEVILQEVYDHKGSADLVDAQQWYLALAKIRSNKDDEAKMILKEIIANPNHYKRTNAQAILTNLE